MRLARFLGLAALLGLLAQPARAADPAFPLKDGDIWVMAGDSITAQHLHSNYFEAFCYARYPKMKFAFRNSGVGGHTIPSTLNRFEYDIAGWKPTVVSVELGMNDSGGTKTEDFVKNMGTMVERIKKSGARPVILSASPVNDGTLSTKLAGRNIRLDEYATALKAFCEKEKLPYADQFHACLDPWGKNKVGGINLQGDPVHPGAPGQLMMAAALLKELGANGFVSSATVDAGAGSADAKGCTVTDIKFTATGGTFDRLDECLPFPIPDNARVVLPLAPDVLALSQYTLAVKGLKDGDYVVKIGGVAAGTFTAKQLAEGVNLTTLGPVPQSKDVTPVVAQMRNVLKAVSDKETLVSSWRGASQKAHAKGADPKLKDDLAPLTAKVEEADAKIREAAKPQKLHFEIVPATK